MSSRRRTIVWGALTAAVVGVTGVYASTASAGEASEQRVTNVRYDADDATEFADLWAYAYGPLELAAGATQEVSKDGITVDATPFTTSYDFSVFDHLKYLGVSTADFAVPESGSLEFSVRIEAETPGTDLDRPIRGCYLSGEFEFYLSVDDPCDRPFSQTVLEGQQASASLNMINFATGQLFDWLVSENRAIALVERLPSTVTGAPGTPVDLAYTQIIADFPIKPGKPHTYSIRYTRGDDVSRAEYFIDHRLMATVDDVGVPLDVQGVPYSGYAPALGAGEPLKDELDSFVIGHGLFSLLDAFPYQHPDAPDFRVSIPTSERIFGQGAKATWDKFVVTTKPG